MKDFGRRITAVSDVGVTILRFIDAASQRHH